MSGLLRRVARTVAVAGVAAAVLIRLSRLQADPRAGRGDRDDDRRDAAAGQPAAEDTSTADPIDEEVAHKVDRLKQLGELRDQGVLSEAEFAEQKARLLTSWPG